MRILRTFILTAIVGTGITSVAQRPDYQDLVILFADGKYDKLLSKCEKYQNKDDSKYDPIPFFYMSRAYFEISKDQTWMQKNDEYKRAYSNALRYAAQYRKKVDRIKDETERKMILRNNRAYLEELKGAIMEDVDLYLNSDDPNYRKAVGELKRLVIFDPDDAGAYLLKSVCEYRAKNRTVGRNDLETADKLLETINFKEDIMGLRPGEELSDIDNWKREVEKNPTARTLMHGLIEITRYFEENREPEKAEHYINIGYPWFQNHETYKDVYDEIVNG